MAIGLYLTPDGRVMVAYGNRRIAISRAEYKANGYKPSIEKLKVKAPSENKLSGRSAIVSADATNSTKSRRLLYTRPGIGKMTKMRQDVYGVEGQIVDQSI
jgi:hypothetical protein